ncbi:uncharacterized protein HGUI_02187 [Hanseniaspora guilliermondii]|uniref:GPI transamidase component GPI17 n=1 Tax=Hanseniaspora guilliermondii TaxID=56406 RepID=A0A1L0B4N3_9ASCO|nr:uncharacterized protein HGUI_02187 [Hanseniaspora guilliermondii]
MNQQRKYLENLNLRKKVTLSIVLLYIFIGLPVWYQLTKVDQYDIRPLLQQEKSSIDYLFKDEDFTNLSLKIPIFLNTSETTYKFPDLIPSVQDEIDTLTRTYKEEYGGIPMSLEIKEMDELSNMDENYVVQLEHTDHVGNSIALYDKLELTVQYDDKTVHDNALPYIIAVSIVNNLFYKKNENFLANELDRSLSIMDNLSVVEYKPRVVLNFNLVVDDNVLANWDLNSIDNTLFNDLINPFIKLFENIYEFEIESNVFYNEDLNMNGVGHDIADVQAKLDYTRLNDNINFIDRDLENVINFAMVLTSSEQDSLSYNIVDWGNIYVCDKEMYLKDDSIYVDSKLIEPLLQTYLEKVFERLTYGNGDLVMNSIDLFIKRAIISNINRINKNIKAVYDMVYNLPVYTDESLNELIPEDLEPYVAEFMNRVFPSLSIPKKIYEQLREIVEKRDSLIDELANGDNVDFKRYLKESFDIYLLSERTFYDHGMVMGGYKSIKHIVAIYLPLLGPMCSIAIGGFIQLVKKPKEDPLLKVKKN